MTRVLALVPARGGSKGIRNKNIKEMNGLPLIQWSIDQVKRELGADQLLVSTEDKQISEIAQSCGHAFDYSRPAELATDTASTEPVMLHGYQWYCKNIAKPDYVMLLQPTSPLRFDKRLNEAVHILEDGQLDSVISVCEEHAFFWRNEQAPIADYDPLNRPRRQDIDPRDRKFRENGSIYLSTADAFEKSGCRVSGRIGFQVMSQEESYEIDTPTDWQIVEKLMEKHYAIH